MEILNILREHRRREPEATAVDYARRGVTQIKIAREASDVIIRVAALARAIGNAGLIIECSTDKLSGFCPELDSLREDDPKSLETFLDVCELARALRDHNKPLYRSTLLAAI